MSADQARHDLGEILSHGEPPCGIGQGEAAEESTPVAAEAFWAGYPGPASIKPAAGTHEASEVSPGQSSAEGNGVVHVDFSGQGPEAA